MQMYSHRYYLLFAAAALNALNVTALFAQSQDKDLKPMDQPAKSDGVIEILTLDIKPGRRNEFHNVYVTQSVPLLKKWNFSLVGYGPSLHDANSYYVVRRFKSLEDREKSEDAFYSSDDWKSGPRDAIMRLVEHFAYAVVSAETWKKVSAEIIMPGANAKTKDEQ
jgi:NIPSNAP protein